MTTFEACTYMNMATGERREPSAPQGHITGSGVTVPYDYDEEFEVLPDEDDVYKSDEYQEWLDEYRDAWRLWQE